MSDKSNSESQVMQWIKHILQDKSLDDITVKIIGNSEKGDGYLGDIIFVDVFGSFAGKSQKEYNLVLKCSKKSETLRNQNPIKDIFLNEMRIYKLVLPALNQFEREKGILHYFDSVPKFYGTFIDTSMEVLALQNLKKTGYNVWDKKMPLTKKHIDMVIRKYGQLHATCVAMNDQRPEEFEKITKSVEDVFAKFNEGTCNDTWPAFLNSVKEIYDILQNDLSEEMLLKWKNLESQVQSILTGFEKSCRLKVILHGDCWNNNFMFLCDNNNKWKPQKVAIIDWQMSRYSSPILDLSYFLFCCISEEDLVNLDTVLKDYYNYFTDHLKELESQSSTLYPFEEFLSDWKKYSRYGLVLASLIHKVCSSDKNEFIDTAESADQGKSLAESFMYNIRNIDALKKRIRPIVKYAVEHDLV